MAAASLALLVALLLCATAARADGAAGGGGGAPAGAPGGGAPLVERHSESAHQYSERDEIALYVNKIGPWKNPSETFEYYTLPFCPPLKPEHSHLTLGEVLEGDRIVESNYDLRFRVNVEFVSLCKRDLTPDEMQRFRKAVLQNYFFEFIFDDLPMWNFVGASVDAEGNSPAAADADPATTRAFLYTHLHFQLGYNGQYVVSANVTRDRKYAVELKAPEFASTVPTHVEFSYSARWYERPDISFEKRFDEYSRFSFFESEMEVHWLAIFNSLVLVVLLLGFLATAFMRMLRRDFLRYEQERDEESEDEKAVHSGWKAVRGDVFRFPQHKMLFAAIVGTGQQFFAVSVLLLLLGVVGAYYPHNRGHVLVSALLLYALTAVIAGYRGVALYKQMGGTLWVWTTFVIAALFAGPFIAVWAVLNSLAWGYQSTQALPFGTIIVISILWLFVGFPLTVLGAVAGSNLAPAFDAPCRVRNAPREIPPGSPMQWAIVQLAVAGFLPFSAVYVELYYVFASAWGRTPYTLYHILALVCAITLICSAAITVALMYFQLGAEDWRWWWPSLYCGGAPALWIFGYGWYYFVRHSEMNGFLQTSFFFGQLFIVAYALFLLLASVGFFSSLAFIRYIYKNLKTD